MSSTVQPAYQVGELVTQSSMQAVQDAARNLVGSSIAGLLGILSANTMDVPFGVVATSGMTITAGGSGGQKALLNTASGPRLVDTIPTQLFTVPTADVTNPRYDILYGTYAQTQIATLSGSTITTSTGDIYSATEALTYTYVTGTAASTPLDPAGPSGSVPLARIIVPALTTSLSSSNIVLLLTNAHAQILSGVAGFVDLTTNQTVAGNKTFTGNSVISGLQIFTSGGRLSLPGIRVDTSNNVILAPLAPGNILYLGYDCTTLTSVTFGPSGVWGYVGPSGFVSSGNLSTYGTNAIITNGVLHVGSSTAFGQIGDGVFERNGPTGVAYLGNTASAYLYFDGANYSFGPSVNGSARVNVPGSVVASSFIVGSTPIVTNYSSDGSVLYAQTGSVLEIYLNSGVVSSYVSSDYSVNIAQAGRQLNLTLPSGIINSYVSSNSSIGIAQTGRQLNLTLNPASVSYPDSFVSDGSLNVSYSGRTVEYWLNQKGGCFPPIYSQTGANISVNMKIVTGRSVISSSSPQTITLSGSAVFTDASTYQVIANTQYSGGSPYMLMQTNNLNASQFTLATIGPVESCTISWIAIGY
jgi:hypothetical protein